jgi:hypothetical protein
MVLLGVAVSGAVLVLVLAEIMSSSRTTYRSEVWVSGTFVDAIAGSPLSGIIVQTVPSEDMLDREQLFKWQQGVLRYDSAGPGPVSWYGITDSTGTVRVKVLVTHDAAELRPFEGVPFVWVRGGGFDQFVDTRSGRWTIEMGDEPKARLELGTVRVRRSEH